MTLSIDLNWKNQVVVGVTKEDWILYYTVKSNIAGRRKSGVFLAGQ